jgi:hypothetical protein
MIFEKSHRFFFLGFILLAMGCVPQINIPLRPGTAEELQNCLAIFPPGPWESVHKIEAVLGGGASATLLGITRGDPAEGSLQTLLLTPEGFTLFEGEFRGGEIIVNKAVPPFDSPAFAKGLMEDVTLLFLAPQIRPKIWDQEADGARVCIWEGPDGFRTEVQQLPDQGWRIQRRDDQGQLTREAALKGTLVQGLAANLELRVLKPVSYKLKMTLFQSGP